LRRALGSRRSQQKMKEIEIKLRAGMTSNGFPDKTQNEVVQFISSFALYGFPESHAASFALIAYASAFLKVRYLGAFTAALLNNWPMGFYHPATIVKDAQRHGLRVKPVDATSSQWGCSLELDASVVTLRIGLRYVRGLQQSSATALVRARSLAPFVSVDDLARRVPQLSKANLAMLARVGALNNLNGDKTLHRRDALWQVERAVRKRGPLLEGVEEFHVGSPLSRMSIEERLVSDYHGTGLTTGPHPMAYRRNDLRRMGVYSAIELASLSDGKEAATAGCVITRQRPGTAKGLIFMTLEDETGTARVIVKPDFYEANRMAVLYERFVQVSGIIQNRDGVVNIIAKQIGPVTVSAAETSSHDFH
jgi:error-prone DNA polymerase